MSTSRKRRSRKAEPTQSKVKPTGLTTPAEKLKLFVSFASEDQAIAEELQQTLADTKLFEVFLTETSLSKEAGAFFTSRILSRINNASVFLLLVSNNSMASKWVTFEYQAALLARNAPHRDDYKIIKLLVEDLELGTTAPPELALFQSIDYRSATERVANLDALLTSISGEEQRIAEQERQQYIYTEAVSPNPRLEMFRRVFDLSFDRAFRRHIGPIQHSVDTIARLKRAQDNIMTPELISVAEAKAFDDIWVVSHSLNNDLHDEGIADSVKTNLDNHIRYTYFLPPTDLISRRLNAYREKYGPSIHDQGPTEQLPSGSEGEAGRDYVFVSLKSDLFMPFDELVIYDGLNAAVRWGYIQLSYEKVDADPLFMRVPDRTLSNIIGHLIALMRQARVRNRNTIT